MPSRAFRILFGKLPHALSAAIQGSTRRIYTRAYANTGRQKCVYACMPRWERRAQITKRALRVWERCITGHWCTAIDGCLLQLTCERRAARTLRASRWWVHATGARIPNHLSPSPMREGENDIIPWWMLHPSGVANISRDATTRWRDTTVDPRRPRSDATQCAPACMRADVVCRVAFIPRGTTLSIDPLGKASASEWSVHRCGL